MTLIALIALIGRFLIDLLIIAAAATVITAAAATVITAAAAA